MKYRFGALGVAVVVALVLGAIAATAAQAALEFTSAAYPTTLEGKPGGANTVFTLSGKPTECTETGLLGVLEGPSNVLLIERSYASCSTTIGGVKREATIWDHECNFRLTITEKIKAGTYTAHVDINCPVGNELEIRVYKSALAHAADSPMCRYTMPAQAALIGVRLTNLEAEPKAIEVAPTVEGITYGVIGGEECGKAGSGGTYTGITKMIGHESKGEPVNIAVN